MRNEKFRCGIGKNDVYNRYQYKKPDAFVQPAMQEQFEENQIELIAAFPVRAGNLGSQ